MRLLITGGAGFMGSDFTRHWVTTYPKDSVLVVDKLTYAGNLNNLSSVKSLKGLEFVKGDIGDEKLVGSLMERVDTVVNFAAESHVDRSILDPKPFIDSNIIGTSVLLRAALDNKVSRFHHISTDEVFGDLPINSKEKFKEDSPYKPKSPYAASKASADHLVRVFHSTYGLPVTLSNSSNNFGPYQFPEKFIPLTITNALENKQVPIYAEGLNVRDWLYVSDHTRAIEAILRKGKIGETYLISANNELSNMEVAKKILKILGKNESLLKKVKDRPGHDQRYALDGSKIKKTLGWNPTNVGIDKDLRDTILWYKNNSKWWKELKNKEYLNYYKRQYAKR